MTWKTLTLFVNTLTADGKYSLLTRDNLMRLNQTYLSQKLRPFVNFLAHFSNLNQILNIIKKKMTLIAYVFPKIQTPKEVVR